jgi:hypothetical protein
MLDVIAFCTMSTSGWRSPAGCQMVLRPLSSRASSCSGDKSASKLEGMPETHPRQGARLLGPEGAASSVTRLGLDQTLAPGESTPCTRTPAERHYLLRGA